ncbi:MAG: 50S ribosomal protein L25/general stress protein Ctc [Alphaproteobacteria bacterium]|nr:50S ribosomal protein L25/general stress protein Ctc [Alphaproteobacteria bacterium]MBF0393023.1 50S ribosomal protein L25/general stress protein Ctc [Alphaproteobacteria bacterium]
MSEMSALSVKLRDRAGKGAARQTRRDGLVPGVIYGDKKPPVLISVVPRAIVIEMMKPGFHTRLFNLDLGDGRTERALARDLQIHPVTDVPVHIDFMRVSADGVVHVAIPVHFINEDKSPGIKRGGVLNVVRHEIDVTCPADSIPPFIEVDLAGRNIGESIHIASLTLPEGVIPVVHRDFTVATIAAPTVTRGAGEGDAG